ncbi:hypothetical protein Ciccas_000400 [Cichlidogyrus casuarinus]|uniref:NOL1/NOP2/Sun domain family member 4 n=1 Tax=Cichlidogyrus casuarinus TaxID=1844966 RepID=A0ABD2QNA1_9PLAT
MTRKLSFIKSRWFCAAMEKRITARDILKPVRKQDNFVSQFLAPVYTRNGWQITQRPLTETNISALHHFDSFYSPHYGVSTWSVIRAALLCPAAKVALVNSFYRTVELENSEVHEMPSNVSHPGHIDVIAALHKTWFGSKLHQNWIKAVNSSSEIQDVTDQNLDELLKKEPVSIEYERSNLSEFVQTRELISEQDFISRDSLEMLHGKTNFSQHLLTSVRIFHDLANDDLSSDVQPAFLANLQHLKVLAREPGSTPMLFDPPKRDDLTQKVQFYPLDLSSVLTVLALGLQPGQSVLDLCAAPGGKSMVMLQTMNPKRLFCCDTSEKRLERLKNVLHSHGPDLDVDSQISVHLGTPQDLAVSGELFDRVLVDVPCSTDKQAVTSDLGSLFSKGKSNERLDLPKKQEKLLL